MAVGDGNQDEDRIKEPRLAPTVLGRAGHIWSRVGVNSGNLSTIIASTTAILAVVFGGLTFFFGDSVLSDDVNPVSDEGTSTAAPEVLQEAPLHVALRFPRAAGCSSQLVGMLAGGPPIESIVFPFTENAISTVYREGGAAWYGGTLDVEFRTDRPGGIVIEEIRFPTRRHDPTVEVAWVAGTLNECGGDNPIRYIQYQLDEQTLVNVDELGRKTPIVESSPVNLRFIEVSPDEPFRISLEIFACSGLFEWQIAVDYSFEGEANTMLVDFDGEPLRSVGGIAGLPLYTVGPGADAEGRVIERSGITTDGSCS